METTYAVTTFGIDDTAVHALSCPEIVGRRIVSLVTDFAHSATDNAWICQCLPVGETRRFEAEWADVRQDEEHTPGAHGPKDHEAEQIERDEALAYAITYMNELGRKAELDDVLGQSQLMAGAEQYARIYKGDFEFMVDMAKAVRQYGRLTEKQAKGTLNCLRAAIFRGEASTVEAKPQTPKPQNEGPTFDFESLPKAAHNVLHVAVPDHTTGEMVFLQIKTRQSGWVVCQEVGGNEDLYLGGQMHGRVYKGKRAAEVAAVLADPKGALEAYGLHFTRCGICGIQLTLAASIERGMGAKCAAKAGW